jgi:hypothetical protein
MTYNLFITSKFIPYEFQWLMTCSLLSKIITYQFQWHMTCSLLSNILSTAVAVALLLVILIKEEMVK